MTGAAVQHVTMPARTLVQLALCTLIWGSTWLVIKTQLGVVPLGWSIAYRFLVAAAVMLAYCVATGKSLRLTPRGHAVALVMALLQFVLNFRMVYAAEKYVTSGVVAVIFALLVVPNALLAWAFLGQRVTARFLVGSAIGMAGVGLLFWRELTAMPAGDGVMLGFGMTLAGVMFASMANVTQAGGFARAEPPHALLALSLLYGGMIDVALAFAFDGPPVIDRSPGYIAGFVYLGAIGSALAFNLYYDTIRTIGPARAAYSSLIVPFVAMALSTAFEGYRWTALGVAGTLLALAGLTIALASRR